MKESIYKKVSYPDNKPDRKDLFTCEIIYKHDGIKSIYNRDLYWNGYNFIYLNAHEHVERWLKEIPAQGKSKLNLKDIEKKIDEILDKETGESIKEFFKDLHDNKPIQTEMLYTEEESARQYKDSFAEEMDEYAKQIEAEPKREEVDYEGILESFKPLNDLINEGDQRHNGIYYQSHLIEAMKTAVRQASKDWLKISVTGHNSLREVEKQRDEALKKLQKNPPIIPNESWDKIMSKYLKQPLSLRSNFSEWIRENYYPPNSRFVN